MKLKIKSQNSGIQALSSETVAISHLVIPEFEASLRWVRAILGGVTIADSKRAMILRRAKRLPVYYFPKEDVRMDLMEMTQTTTEAVPQGETSFWHIKVGETIAEKAAWGYLNPPDEWEMIKDYIALEWGKMDSWYEEEEEVFVHLRDPYHRVDVLDSSRHVRVIVAGETVAETRNPKLLFETGFPTRYYFPREDVRMDNLESSTLKTRCPYKGIASYWSVKVGDQIIKNIVWGYPNPVLECPKIKDLFCFYNERVEAIYVDGELVPKPNTPWSS